MSLKDRSPAARDGEASGKGVQAARRNASPDNKPDENCKRVPQLRCEMCGVKFDKGVGRRRQFCSDACRKAASRTAKRTTQVSSPVQSGNGLKNTDTSV